MSLNSGVNKTLNHFTVRAVATADHQIAYCDIGCRYDAIRCCHSSYQYAGSPHTLSK